jgi:hypothetical protein
MALQKTFFSHYLFFVISILYHKVWYGFLTFQLTKKKFLIILLFKLIGLGPVPHCFHEKHFFSLFVFVIFPLKKFKFALEKEISGSLT